MQNTSKNVNVSVMIERARPLHNENQPDRTARLFDALGPPVLYGNPEGPFTRRLLEIQEVVEMPETPQVVYVGSSTHVDVATAFGRENVVHVDPDESACKVLESNGYLAEPYSLEDYVPERQFDVLVALNTYGRPSVKRINRVLKPGGLAISDNKTRWANNLSKMKNMELLGGIPDYRVTDSQWLDSEWLKRVYLVASKGVILPAMKENPASDLQKNINPNSLYVFQDQRPTSTG